MKRWLLSALTALSGLMLVTSVVFWLRSYFVGEVLYAYSVRPPSGCTTTVNLGSRRGGLYYTYGVARFRSLAHVSPEFKWGRERVDAAVYPDLTAVANRPVFDVGGFGFVSERVQDAAPVSDDYPTESTQFGLVVPYWARTLAAAVPTTLLTARWRRQARRRFRLRHQLCPRCGYDLRASSAGRCPECGEAAPAPAS